MNYRQYFTRKLIHPLLKLITQGVAPKRLALTVAFGVVISLFPVFGLSFFLSLASALLLRLNIAVLQLINYFMYPLWLLLFIPFLSAGNMLFDEPAIQLSFEEIEHLYAQDLKHAIKVLGMAHVRAVLVWAATAPIIGTCTYYLTLPLFKKYALRKLKVT